MTETKTPMRFFDSFDEQEIKDLNYGGQAEGCLKLATAAEVKFEDGSIEGDWIPEED